MKITLGNAIGAIKEYICSKISNISCLISLKSNSNHGKKHFNKSYDK